jgi:hypothetical protein
MTLLSEIAAYLSTQGIPGTFTIGAFAPEPASGVCLRPAGGPRSSAHSNSTRQRVSVIVRDTSLADALSTASSVRTHLHRRGNMLSETRGYCLAYGSQSATGPDRRGLFHVSSEYEWLLPNPED